jgi:hypothetical protein
VFEQAVRAEATARWHLGTCGWTTYLRREKRPTADVDPGEVCLKCARAARRKLPPDETTKPHGRVIVAAAARHLVTRTW